MADPLDPRVPGSRVPRSGVAPNRQVANQIRERAAEQVEQREGFRDVDPRDDFEVNDSGLSLLDEPRREAAANRFQDTFPDQTLGSGDVQQSGGGFAPTETVQRRGAANRFEDQTPLGEIDPQEDVTQTDSGFGLAQEAQREVAAIELDDQFGRVDVSPSDVRQDGDGFGLTTGAQREVAAERFESQTAADQLDPQEDVTLSDGEPQLTEAGQRQVGAAELDAELPDVDIGEDDVSIEDNEVVVDNGVFR